ILALGGGSWARLGSDGRWVSLLREKGMDIRDLRPTNCGFLCNWSQHLSSRFAGQPLKPVVARLSTTSGEQLERRGECIITEDGLEGSLVYALSAPLRELLERDGQATLQLDLAPDRTPAQLAELLTRPRKRAGLDGLKVALLHECLERGQLLDSAQLAAGIKALPIRLHGTRPLDEAISSAGGIARQALDDQLMLRRLPGVFCAGEMLDWEAPTGGYLLTA